MTTVPTQWGFSGRPRPEPTQGRARGVEVPAQVRRAAVPAAVLAGLAGLFWFSGVPFTDQGSASDGVVLRAADGATVLTVTALQPGEAVSRTVTISNPSTSPSRLTMTETAAPAEFDQGRLRLVIERDGERVYAGQFGAMADFAMDQGWLEPGSRATYTFTVSLPESGELVAPGTQTATASYVFDTHP